MSILLAFCSNFANDFVTHRTCLLPVRGASAEASSTRGLADVVMSTRADVVVCMFTSVPYTAAAEAVGVADALLSR
ncbi:hypothetical protein Aduo_015392 [Ancylostoma duodenale]